MRNEIAKVFYDKEVSILTSNVSVDAEGGVNYRGYDVASTFKGNVNFSNCKKIQEEYGLDYQIDVSITTDYELVKHNDIIKYNGVVYCVTDVFIRDSHVLIVASKWQM